MKKLALLLLIPIVSTALPAHAGLPYATFELFPDASILSGSVTGMNDLGQVVGNLSVATGTSSWVNGTLVPNMTSAVGINSGKQWQTLPLSPNGPVVNLYVNDINNAGQIIGVDYISQSTPQGNLELGQGFLYDHGTFTAIGPRDHVAICVSNPLGITSQAYCSAGEFFSPAFINNKGQILGSGVTPQNSKPGAPLEVINSNLGNAGQFLVSSRPTVNAIYSNGQFQAIAPDSTPYAFGRTANGFNDAGQVIGGVETACGMEAALYSGGDTQVLDSCIPGQPWRTSFADGLNNEGQVVGAESTINGGMTPVVFSNGSVNDIGSAIQNIGSGPYGGGAAKGINDNGYIVGTRTSDFWHPNTAFVYHDGQAVDLNTLTYVSQGWHLTDTVAINDAGDILAVESVGDTTSRYVVLIPVPELPVSAMFAMAVVVMAGLRRRGVRQG